MPFQLSQSIIREGRVVKMSKIVVQGETIVAIATAVVPQQGSVGIVRMSGKDAGAIARLVFHAPGHQVWETHRILYGYVRHPQTQQVVDEALLLIMQSPRSYTRRCGGISLSRGYHSSAASVAVVP